MPGGVPDHVAGEGAERALDEAGGPAADGLKPGRSAAAGVDGDAGVRGFVIHGFLGLARRGRAPLLDPF